MLPKQIVMLLLHKIMLMPLRHLLPIQQTLNNKLTMLEEEEFGLLEMLLDGEHKLLPKILLEMLVQVDIITSHTL